MPPLSLPLVARSWALTLALAAGLAACGPRGNGASDGATAAVSVETAPGAGSGSGAGAGGAPPPATDAPTDAPRAYIAEEHTFRFAPPAARLKADWQQTLDACHRLGAGCEVEEANLFADDDGVARRASLAVRVANARAGAFLADLEAAGPRGHEIARADKTTEVIDTDARLANAEQLRARLQALRDGAAKLSDVVDLETRIAEVQGRIEAARASREYLRRQTEKTKIIIAYDADGRALDGRTWAPVREAFGDIGSTLATTVGVLVRTLTVLVPVLLVVWPLVWLFRRFGRRRAARGLPPSPPSA